MQKTLKASLLAGTAGMALLAAYSSSANAQMYSTGPGVYLSVEGRYLWGRGDKVHSYDLPITTPFTLFGSSGPTARADKGWGGKAMLGYRFNNNWDIGLGVSGGWLKGKKSGVGTLTTTTDVETPAGVTNGIKVKLRYEVADFEAGYNWQMGTGSTVRLFGGARYAHFNQTAKATIDTTTGSIGGFTHVGGKRKTSYSGIGPRLGLNAQLGIGNSGFNVFGGVSGALLYGKFKDRHSITATGTAGPFAASGKDKSKNKLVPNAEGEIGLGYNFNAGGSSSVGIQLGYRAEGWWGVSSSAAVLAPGPATRSSDQMMHGPFVRLVATFGSPAMAPVAPPPPPPPAVAPRKAFIVFFDFDRSNITAEGQKTINDAVAAAKAGNSTRVTLTGHTDRSGSEQYNQALSVRRGEAVKAAMIRQGIPASAIVVIGRGESQNLVPTADGVREPQNRRVEIVI
jgi:outer membrane protein OmpA-like peptidoglycan-associated protein